MRHRIKEFIIKIGLVLASLIIVLLVFEFFFRMFRGPDSWLKLTVGKIDSKFHHSLKPNITIKSTTPKDEISYNARINNLGLRGKDVSIKKPEGIKRILMVGDSFTFGVGAQDNETIPYYFEEIIKKKYGSLSNFEVINCGMGLLCTTLHYINLRDKYLQLSPSLVFLFYDLTDLWDDWELEKNLIYDKKGNILRCDARYVNGEFDWWLFLREHSKFADWVYDKIIRTYRKMRILGFWNYIKGAIEGKRSKGTIANLKDISIDPITYDGLFFTRGREREREIRRHWNRSAKFLLMIRDMLRENGIELIMVIYPNGIYVGPNQWAQGRLLWGFESGKTYTDYFCFELMEEFAKENQIELINLLPAFLSKKDKKLFFDYDGHFTPTANKIVAEALASNAIFNRKLDLLLRKPDQEQK